MKFQEGESPTYKQARSDESLKQSYLDFFIFAHPCEDVSAPVYNRDKKPALGRVTELELKGCIDDGEAKELRGMIERSEQYAFLILSPSMIGKGDRHPVFVNPRAFQELDEVELEFSLVDHEFFHARDFRYGISLSNGIVVNHLNAYDLQPSTLGALLDTRALLNQLFKGRSRGLEKTGFFRNVKKDFLRYHIILRSIEAQNPFEEIVIKNHIESYLRILQEGRRKENWMEGYEDES